VGEQGPGKWLVLDADLPLDLAAGLEFAHDFREDFQARGYALVLAPTAAEEIWLNNPAHPRRQLAGRPFAA
jgi:hypothetical protein